jgi:hypothetical protein
MVVRVGRDKLAAHSSSAADEIKDSLAGIKELGDDPEADARTRLIAKKFLVEHDWAVYEHENPVIDKSEVLLKGLPQIPSRIDVRIVD